MPGNVVEVMPAMPELPIWDQRLKVAAYCRVSTAHEEQKRSLEYQIDHYINYIHSNPTWTLAGIYHDTASVVRKKKRAGYQKLMRDCSHRKMDLILVKSQPLWPGLFRNNQTNQEAQENEYWRLCGDRRNQHLD